MITLPQIALLSKKFDKVYVQPNYYQTRYNKESKDLDVIRRFCLNHNLGVEFEIDFDAIIYTELYMRALLYFENFKWIEDKAFYLGGEPFEEIEDLLLSYFKDGQRVYGDLK